MRTSLFNRYLGVFLVSIQDAVAGRSIEFVWFLLTIVNTMSVLLLWTAGFSNKSITGKISLPSVELYYIFLLFGAQVLMSHVEEVVSREDIKEGGLTKYLVKPISYFWFRFFCEIPWRISGFFFSFIAFL